MARPNSQLSLFSYHLMLAALPEDQILKIRTNWVWVASRHYDRRLTMRYEHVCQTLQQFGC
ncbi:MAG: hypothetical protein M0Z56_09680, partial [Desulfobacteraceae bacterium]|nr:hypothetical protein [Desulfobacteraceae bacterium]